MKLTVHMKIKRRLKILSRLFIFMILLMIKVERESNVWFGRRTARQFFAAR